MLLQAAQATSARMSSTPRSLWSLHSFTATFPPSQALPRHRKVCSLFPLGLSPRPVTHRHVTLARPTSLGTPLPFNSTRPSASLSTLHSPIGSGHCPAARIWTLGTLARTTPHSALPLARARPAARLGSCDPARNLATHRSSLRLGPLPQPDQEAASRYSPPGHNTSS